MTGGGADTLRLFARFVTSHLGLHFPEERLPELAQKMNKVAQLEAAGDLEGYLLRLMAQPPSREDLRTLARALTIGETYFLRDPKSYQVLTDHVIPALLANRRQGEKTIRIWSAGCSSGEEAYSIAILLTRTVPDLDNWNITILATDINPQALERARRGVYGQWSFRNTPPWLMDYFVRRPDGRYELKPQIRKMVRFSEMNLADEASFRGNGVQGMDIIFCRNVMLYFDRRHIDKTLALLRSSLRESGWLMVGPAEIHHAEVEGFSCRRFDGAFVLCKGTAELAAPLRAETALPLPLAPPQKRAPAAVPRAEATDGDPSAPTPFATEDAERAQPDEPPEKPAATAQTGSAYAEAADLYEKGLYREAADAALAESEDAEATEALTLRARALANLGRLDEARACCERAIARDRLKAHNHYLLSIILEQQGDAAAAIKALKHALFVDHDYLLAYFALGNLNRRFGLRSEAERNFSNALRLLEKRHPHDVVPEAEGMTAGRLAQMIREGLKAGLDA